MEVRCKHCCKTLFKGDSILYNSHHQVKQDSVDVGCQEADSDCCSYMILEDVPCWVMKIIDQVSWTKGKLHCPYCNSRIGSFSFVSDPMCNCDKYVKPPIKIVNSKIDIMPCKNVR